MHPVTSSSTLTGTHLLPGKPFFYLRHGQTDWNATGHVQGHSDIPLNATGIAQAEQAGRILQGQGIGRIVTSPLKRALTTAEAAQKALGIPLEIEPALMEWNFGALEGRQRDEELTARGFPLHGSILDILPPDAETPEAMTLRATQAVYNHLSQWPETLLFVGHGAFFKALTLALGLPDMGRFGNAEPYLLNPPEAGSRIWQVDLLALPHAKVA